MSEFDPALKLETSIDASTPVVDPIKKAFNQEGISFASVETLRAQPKVEIILPKNTNIPAKERELYQDKDSFFSIHPGELARSFKKLGLKKLDAKVEAALESVHSHIVRGIYPYNRYLSFGAAHTSTVTTPSQNKQQECIVWCTNLYLGLNRHPQVLEAIKSNLDVYGIGCGTSAISGGFNSLHKTLEANIASFLEKEECVLFSTGFTANLGALSTFASPDDLVIFDRDCHSSIFAGIQLSGAKFRAFRSGDVAHLEQILESSQNSGFENIFVATESVFSMTGEEAPLSEYAALKHTYNFYLFVDEAHSFGIYGHQGRGLSNAQNCIKDVDFLMGTLSKATGAMGGFVACKSPFANLLRISSISYLFQACLPNPDTIAAVEALKIIQNNPDLREKLWKNTLNFRNGLLEMGFDVGKGKSPIVPIYVSDDAKLATLCKELYENGIYTNWAAYPSVKKGEGRLRFIVSSEHTPEEVQKTLDILNKVGKKNGVIL